MAALKIYDVIVVGSGCSGAMTAQTLIEGGREVHMLDGGILPANKIPIPRKDFVDLRHTDQQQYKYFIGEEGTDIPWGEIGKGAQITPNRKHMVKGVDHFLPLHSETFSPVESLGYGGLGIGWGLQCWQFSEQEIKAAGMNPKAMWQAYEIVANRIGVSGTADKASAYTLGKLKNFQTSPAMDNNHRRIYKKYQALERIFHNQDFYIGRTPLALLTKSKFGRKAYRYLGMDYNDDQDLSAWRPWITINNLRKHENFIYTGQRLVVQYKEKNNKVEIKTIDMKSGKKIVYLCRTLVLCSGALGSARIALRSQSSPKPLTKTPLLCNPYTYIPCLQLSMMGQTAERHKLGLGQLSLFHDPAHNDFNLSVASLYSYQSLLLFRILRQLPLNFKDARSILQYLSSALIVAGVHHPDAGNKKNYLELQPDTTSPTGDRLLAHYQVEATLQSKYQKREKVFMRKLRRLGVYPLKRTNPGYGSSIHYAGTLPFSDTPEPLTLSRKGKLHGAKNVFVADSSGFTYLPARGLTFSLLANAHLTAQNILEDGKDL